MPDVPPCVEKKLGLVSRRALRFTPGKAKSPLRPARKTVQPAARTRNSSTKTTVTGRAIGERLVARAAGKPDKMLTETPVGAASASPMRKRRASESPQMKSKKAKKNPLAPIATMAMVKVGRKRCLKLRRGATEKMQNNEC